MAKIYSILDETYTRNESFIPSYHTPRGGFIKVTDQTNQEIVGYINVDMNVIPLWRRGFEKPGLVQNDYDLDRLYDFNKSHGYSINKLSSWWTDEELAKSSKYIFEIKMYNDYKSEDPNYNHNYKFTLVDDIRFDCYYFHGNDNCSSAGIHELYDTNFHEYIYIV